MGSPIVSWHEGTQDKIDEITGAKKVDYGTVESDFSSNQKAFYIWNNRDGETDVSKMEEVTFITKDRLGGTGDTVGNIVEAVRDNWIHVRVDTLDGDGFDPVGKDGAKVVGTTGTTINPKAGAATTWVTGTVLSVGDYKKPTVENGFIYKVSVGGTTGGAEPTWSLTEGNVVTDETVQYIAEAKTYTPAAQEILGVKNSVLDDGSNASDAAGNFIKLTAFAEVPVTASSGKNQFIQRIFTGALIQ